MFVSTYTDAAGRVKNWRAGKRIVKRTAKKCGTNWPKAREDYKRYSGEVENEDGKVFLCVLAKG